ncbi:hypothetical protein MHYP_G00199150 [Metynnis hypsauchen]
MHQPSQALSSPPGSRRGRGERALHLQRAPTALFPTPPHPSSATARMSRRVLLFLSKRGKVGEREITLDKDGYEERSSSRGTHVVPQVLQRQAHRAQSEPGRRSRGGELFTHSTSAGGFA